MKPSIAIRWILSAFLITGAWRETGIFNGVCWILMFLTGGLIYWVAGDELKEMTTEKLKDIQRKREARRK